MVIDHYKDSRNDKVMKTYHSYGREETIARYGVKFHFQFHLAVS